VTVCVPARDEAQLIGRALHALHAQRGIDGRPLPTDFFDIIVYANNCRDGTAEVVRALARTTAHPPIHVVEESLAADRAHIGYARKRVLDIAARRFAGAARFDGIIASIDSDTVAAEDWIAWIVREMAGRDAVAGSVTLAESEQGRLLAPVRLLYAREVAYRRILAEVEALVDPRPEDPAPRHGSFVGASFAVNARAYFDAGGLPPLRRLEDVAFARALHRIDARVRYSPLVRATTSARLVARVDGGFGTFMAELQAHAHRGTSFTVEHPRRTLDDLEARAAVRRIRAGAPRPADVARVSDIFGLASTAWLPLVNAATPVGTSFERIAEQAAGRRDYPPERVENAIETLRAVAAEARAKSASALGADAAQTLDVG
jgi:glycosyltransferase involved in cell wall biosynthesis